MVRPGDRMFVILLRPGPAWRVGKPVIEQDLDDHRAYFGSLDARGQVALAGPFLDLEAGGMIVLRAANVADAAHLMNDDPAVVSGVFAAALRPFYAMFAGGADARA